MIGGLRTNGPSMKRPEKHDRSIVEEARLETLASFGCFPAEPLDRAVADVFDLDAAIQNAQKALAEELASKEAAMLAVECGDGPGISREHKRI